MTKSSILVETATGKWIRTDRRMQGPHLSAMHPDLQAEVRPQYEAAERERRRIAEIIRKAAHERRFIDAFDLMGWFDERQVGFLEQMFPAMTPDERATSLQYVWCRLRIMPSRRRALSLFRRATLLRANVPAALPRIVEVFRGASCPPSFSQPAQNARSRVRKGISWTTDRTTALTFAQSPMAGDVGCIGRAQVRRSAILAYFMDPTELEIDGERLAVDGYHEHECIIDPSALERVTYESVDSVSSRERKAPRAMLNSFTGKHS